MSVDPVNDQPNAPPTDERNVVPSNRLTQWVKYCFHLLGLGGKGLILLVGLLMIAWLSSGIYKVQSDELGVVLRFDRWIETTDSGLHYHLRYPIETVMLPKVTQVNQLNFESHGALTPPGLVIDAFNDVQRAKADQERGRNEAESYANDIWPRARGEASRITQEANACYHWCMSFWAIKSGSGLKPMPGIGWLIL